jgi:hypothetical protein
MNVREYALPYVKRTWISPSTTLSQVRGVAFVSPCLTVCVCVCVREREREVD